MTYSASNIGVTLKCGLGVKIKVQVIKNGTNVQCTPCPRKKGATDFFAVTFTNIDGFS